MILTLSLNLDNGKLISCFPTFKKNQAECSMNLK
jgi:hypothetical protein